VRPFPILFLLAVLVGSSQAENYQEYVARHQRMQKMMNPLNVPVANVMSDAWDANPEYANPNQRVSTPGPKKFTIKSSRDDQGRVTCFPKPK
jgi:hypothetical protein